MIGNRCTLIVLLEVSGTMYHFLDEERRDGEEVSLYGLTSSMKLPWDIDVRATSDSVQREQRMRVLY